MTGCSVFVKSVTGKDLENTINGIKKRCLKKIKNGLRIIDQDIMK